MVPSLAIAALVLALIPAGVYWANRRHFRRPRPAAGPCPPVSVLIPARNEERSIAAALVAALATRGVEIELIVLDDQSTDGTRAIVHGFVARDSRIRCIESEPLPAGWCGKQFACQQLARAAAYDLLLFVDADVRLEPDAVARLVNEAASSGLGLLSGIPRQRTVGWLEKLVIPLIHFVLLGYCPLFARQLRRPAYAAGCGQVMLVRRDAYEAAGGHESIRASRHDGLTLPRSFRRAGFATDICDLTGLATCRMYDSGRDLWLGLAKNAGEGLGSPAGILPWTILLLGGLVLPFVLLPWAPMLAGAAVAAIYSIRFDAARRYRQSWLGAILHPIGVTLLIAIQWHALVRACTGRPIAWKNRAPSVGR